MQAVVHCDAPTTLSLVGLDAQVLALPLLRPRRGRSPTAHRTPRPPARRGGGLPLRLLRLRGRADRPTIEALVEQRRARSVIAYDPNVRLNVEPDLGVWRRRVDWMAARCHLLKLSDEDFERLYPGRFDALAALAWPPGCVVMLTRGGEALAWTAQGRCRWLRRACRWWTPSVPATPSRPPP